MAKAIKKDTTLPPTRPSWPFNWSEFDKTFENFRRDLERTFGSLPSISMPSIPKMATTSCDVLDEGKNLRVTMDVPGVKKNEINLNVTDNSIEISAKHKEAKEEKKEEAEAKPEPKPEVKEEEKKEE